MCLLARSAYCCFLHRRASDDSFVCEFSLQPHNRESICVDNDWWRCHSMMSLCWMQHDGTKWTTFNCGSESKTNNRLNQLFERRHLTMIDTEMFASTQSHCGYVICLCHEAESVVVKWWWLTRVADLCLFIYFAFFAAAVLPGGAEVRESFIAWLTLETLYSILYQEFCFFVCPRMKGNPIRLKDISNGQCSCCLPQTFHDKMLCSNRMIRLSESVFSENKSVPPLP